jgi:hypothetical protein
MHICLCMYVWAYNYLKNEDFARNFNNFLFSGNIMEEPDLIRLTDVNQI